jgi:hypothetical protein
VSHNVMDRPRVIDVRIDLLRKSDHAWLPTDDLHISLGDHVALRCWNNGDREVSATVFMRTMTGELRPVSTSVQDLLPHHPAEFGTVPYQPIVFGEKDVAIVLVVSHQEEVVQELLQSLRHEEALPQDVTPLSQILRGQPSESAISDEDLEDLLGLAERDEFGIGACALQALTLLQPPRLTKTRLSQLIRNRLRIPQLIHRPWLISIAVNLGDASVREHLRGIAADSTDPQSRTAQQALAEVGDEEILAAVTAALEGSGEDAYYAAPVVAARYPDFDMSATRGEELESDRRAFWIAMAAARKGSFTALQQHVTEADNISFRRLVGDDANIYYAARDMRPLPAVMRYHLQETLRTRRVAADVTAFYEQLLGENRALTLSEGTRTVPDDCVEIIRRQLGAIPGITSLESFTAEVEADVWARAASLSPAHRGVLLNELLNSAATRLSPAATAAAVNHLVKRWDSHLWYPNLNGLLQVLRSLAERSSGSISPGAELQLGWLLSRAPITQLLRLINERIKRSVISESDIRALTNATITHWDSTPPPTTARVTRVPQMIQQISLIEEQPGRKTRAWLENKSRTGDQWVATITISIGAADDESLAGGLPGLSDERNTREGFSELIIVPRANGGTVTPGSKEIRFPGNQEAASVTFEITTGQDALQLLISIYQRQPTTLLQELKGVIELGRGGGSNEPG